jgi:hypothetical protein
VSGSETGPGQPVRLARLAAARRRPPIPAIGSWSLFPAVGLPLARFGGVVDGPATLGGLAG